jgi:streptomycin 6-kinase
VTPPVPSRLFIPATLRRNVAQWEGAAGEAWLASLPSTVEALCARWSLSVERAFSPGGAISWAAPATGADGTPCVLKIGFPHSENEHEADALRAFNGDGAVELLDDDAASSALLLERCMPGHSLQRARLSLADETAVATSLLRSLWRVPPEGHRFRALKAVASEWATLAERRQREMPRRFDEEIVDLGIGLLRGLPASAEREVLLHGDFHPGNVLASARVPWLAIDPKPMVGDPAYDAAHLLLQLGQHRRHRSAADWSRRLGALADGLGLEANRIGQWTVARSIESCLWYASVGDWGSADHSMDDARQIADVLRPDRGPRLER